MKHLILTFVLVLGIAPARAEIKLAVLFRDHAVLQRGIPLPVWGTATPGSRIRVAFQDQMKETTTGTDGKWRVMLDPLETGSAAEMTISGDGEIVLRDLLVGEVWFASGQSNMKWYMAQSINAKETNTKEEIANANYPAIRLFNIIPDGEPPVSETYTEPLEDAPGKSWHLATPETVRIWSCVAWYFAKELHEKLGVPVGIIQAAVGGSPVLAWMSREKAQAEFPKEWLDYEKLKVHAPELLAEHERKLTEWTARKEAAKNEGTPFKEPRPIPPITPYHRFWITGLFNAAVNPAIPYGIRGVIWYQGEADSASHAQYAKRFSAMIADWRARWRLGDFPFLFVQLPNWKQAGQPGEFWAHMREAQAAVAAQVPNTGMAVTIDVGDPVELHPPDKRPVANRLALLALDGVYHVQNSPKSPAVADWKIEGAQIAVRFDHAEKLAWKEGLDRGFEIAGYDGKFHPATAELRGDTAVLVSDAVPEPAAFRYAWGNAPDSILFNEVGLPAAPFRSKP